MIYKNNIICFIFFLFALKSKSQIKLSDTLKGGFKVSDVQRIWAFDSCGMYRRRDSIMNLLVKHKSLFDLNSTDILFLLGKPLSKDSSSTEHSFAFFYNMLCAYDYNKKRCNYDHSATARIFLIEFDQYTEKVTVYEAKDIE